MWKFNDIELIEEIVGGKGQDNDLNYFWDYVDTITRMRSILVKKGCKEPFIIYSDQETYNNSRTNNHVRDIAVQYAPEDYKEIPVVKLMVVCEQDYIMSRTYVKEWVVEELLKKDKYDHRLLLTDGKVGVITGHLTLV